MNGYARVRMFREDLPVVTTEHDLPDPAQTPRTAYRVAHYTPLEESVTARLGYAPGSAYLDGSGDWVVPALPHWVFYRDLRVRVVVAPVQAHCDLLNPVTRG